MNFICEGLDRLGKDTLVNGILHSQGYHLVLHRGKPHILDAYANTGTSPAFLYQKECFSQDMTLLNSAELFDFNVIFNRSWIGESVYASFYRDYSGDYVFDLERAHYLQRLKNTRLILLTEDFSLSQHFMDDGLSLGPVTKRKDEQERFLKAFERSLIADKRVICVTDPSTGLFKSKMDILTEALNPSAAAF